MEIKDTAILQIMGLTPAILESENPEMAYAAFQRADEIKGVLDDYMSNLREQLFKLAEKKGKMDDKGSFSVKFEDGTGFKKEARVSVRMLTDKVKELGQAKGLPLVGKKPYIVQEPEMLWNTIQYLEEHMPDAVDYEEIPDEAAIQQAYADDKISDVELQSLVDRKVTYALKRFK